MSGNDGVFNGKKKIEEAQQEDFLMSPKIDFAFKLIFGDKKNKEVLIAFLSAIIKMPVEEFESIEIINNELLREFQEDKKGILDVRVSTQLGKQIDIEIQILPTDFMPERTMFYWSKIYTGQIKAGDTYDKLKKCITINIVDFACTPLKKIHTSYHITEDATGYKLTDILEVHFLEIPKLRDKDVQKDEEDSVVLWMEFLDAKSRGVMEMLAQKNEDIKKAYSVLEILSKDERARMAYEAREAEVKDQLTRIKTAEEKGRKEGIKEGIEKGELNKAIKTAKAAIDKGLPKDIIADITGLKIEEIEALQKE